MSWYFGNWPMVDAPPNELPAMCCAGMSLHVRVPAMGSINGAALRAIREHQTPRITQEELAERVGISQGALSNLESGKRMGSPDVIRALALHLNVPIAAITYPHAECPNCAKAVA